MGRRLPWKKPEESPAGVSKATAQSSPAVGSARAAFIASPAAASSPFRRSRGPATPRRLNITDEGNVACPDSGALTLGGQANTDPASNRPSTKSIDFTTTRAA